MDSQEHAVYALYCLIEARERERLTGAPASGLRSMARTHTHYAVLKLKTTADQSTEESQ